VTLKDPAFLYLLLLYLPMVWVYLSREKKARPAVRYTDISLLKSVQSPVLRIVRHTPFVLRCIGFGLLVVALARPQKGSTEREISTKGVDIMLVMDVSTSMKALDFKPHNRLHAAKETVKSFIHKRGQDRIGLVVFAGRSYTKCPLTLDYTVLESFIDDIDFGQVEDGTAIGTALATGANRLHESEARSRIIILLTDGSNNAGEIAPLPAAEAAGKLGIKVYTIAVGKQDDVPYPVQVQNPFTGKITTRIQNVTMEVDEETLKEIAGATGGTFFRAHNAQELVEIYEEIDRLEKTEIKTKTYTTYTDTFYLWLLCGAALLMVELLLHHTLLRRVP